MIVEIGVKLFLVAGIICLVLLQTQLIPHTHFPEPKVTSENSDSKAQEKAQEKDSEILTPQCPEIVPVECEVCPKCPVCPEPLHTDFENHQIMFSEPSMLAALNRIKLAKNVHSVHIMFAGHSVHIAVASLSPLYLTAKALELCIENNGSMIDPKLDDNDLYIRCIEPMARLLHTEAGAGRAQPSFFYPDNKPPAAEDYSPAVEEEKKVESSSDVDDRPMGKLHADISQFDQ